MNPLAATRAIALALILCLLALDGAHHVHLPDAGTAQTDCSLCAGGGAAKAPASSVVVPVIPFHSVPIAAQVVAPAARAPAQHVSIRGPPATSVA